MPFIPSLKGNIVVEKWNLYDSFCFKLRYFCLRKYIAFQLIDSL